MFSSKRKNNLIYCLIPGVSNPYPQVDIFFKNPEGSLTNGLFPTGNRIDIINETEVTCIDAAVPMIIISQKTLNISRYDSKNKLSKLKLILSKIEDIRVKAGLMMKIKDNQGKLMSYKDIKESITVPKVAIVDGGNGAYDISAIYLTPKEIHNSIAVSGGCCLAYACSVSNTIASRLFKGNEVRIKHFEGISQFGCIKNKDATEVYTKRNAQIYMKGEFYIY
ncbi:PrpF domain-containing protein [Bartonella sp. DGB2]|uniref:PrpF domain-containing protein n=1 Tax=Bartonella sp. DGB2 TaxID=3388426 RepID=UPI00398FAD06